MATLCGALVYYSLYFQLTHWETHAAECVGPSGWYSQTEDTMCCIIDSSEINGAILWNCSSYKTYYYNDCCTIYVIFISVCWSNIVNLWFLQLCTSTNFTSFWRSILFLIWRVFFNDFQIEELMENPGFPLETAFQWMLIIWLFIQQFSWRFFLVCKLHCIN